MPSSNSWPDSDSKGVIRCGVHVVVFHELLPGPFRQPEAQESLALLLIAVKKQADIAVGESQWDGCLTMDSCNPSGEDDRGWARWRHLVAVVFFVPAQCAR